MEFPFVLRWSALGWATAAATLAVGSPGPLDDAAPRILLPGLSAPAFPAQATGTVKEIIVKGNKTQTKEGILATMRTKVGAPFNQATLDQDRETLFDLGVFRVEPNVNAIQNPDGTYSVTVEVVENPVIKEIRVVGETVVTQAQILAVTTLKTGEIYSNRQAGTTSAAIEQLYVKKGYYAKVVDISYLPDSPQTLNIQIQEETVSSVRITGNTRTKKRVLDHLIKTRAGEAFNANKWDDDLRRLFNTRWFDKIDPKEDTSVPGQIALGADVKEGRTGVFGFGFQVDPESALSGFLRYTESNYKGTGQKLDGGVTYGTRGGGPSVDVGYGNPFLDGKDTSMQLSLYSRVIYRFANDLFGANTNPTNTSSYIERRTGGILGFSRPIGENLSASISTRVEGVHTLDIDTQNGNGFIQQDGLIGSFTAGLIRDTRDITIDASHGSYLSLTAEPGISDITKVGGLISNESYIGTSFFTKYYAEYRGYFSDQPPRPHSELDAPRRVLALRLRAGTIAGKVPFFEQYFAGGVDTIRGYDEERFWGKNTVLGTVELRLPIQKSFNFILFADVGDAWGGYGSVNNFMQTSSPRFHVGFGPGLAFKTPLGLMRIDLGFNDHYGTRVHFQIGPSF